jgi:hypothetical protein
MQVANAGNVDRNKKLSPVAAGMLMGKSGSHISKLQADEILPRNLTVGAVLDYIATADTGRRRSSKNDGERMWYLTCDEATAQQIINTFRVRIDDPRELAKQRAEEAKEKARKDLEELGLVPA